MINHKKFNPKLFFEEKEKLQDLFRLVDKPTEE